MADFDEKLNALLSNPERMAEIMQMAQSFASATAEPTASTAAQEERATPPKPPPQAESSAETVPPMPDLSALFSSLAGGLGAAGGLGGLNPKLMARLLPLALEFGSPENGETRALLNALRPFLKPERQEKIDRALRLARMVHIGKKFLAGWEG